MGELYKAYLTNQKSAAVDKSTKTVTFEHEGISYRVITTKRRANRLSLIRCVNNAVVWEQIPLLYLRYNERGRGNVIDNIPVSIDKNMVTLFVIKGKPRSIWGLDEGIFRSAKRMDASYVTLMSEKRMKEL